MINDNIIYLPKGGIIIDTSIGSIQLGAPPETIKDSLIMQRDVPEFFIAPKNLFSYKRMLSLMDIEFPCNYNFFIQKRKTSIICTEEQMLVINGILKESIIGPDKLNIDLEYINGKNNPYYPNMGEEMKYFRKHPVSGETFRLEDIVQYIIITDKKTTTYKNLDIKLDKDNSKIQITDSNKKYTLPWDINYNDEYNNRKIYSDIFIPPSFGITTLGSSHGFDPKGKTSGFIFWINGVGIMVDPPVDSALWLIEQNVSPKMVNSVILTHCHSDHDSGVMQKILQEGRITLYTTPTIFSSFVKKISLLTGLHEIDIIELIDFIPVMIAKPININGAILTFSYRLHSIPTIGFEINFKGKSVVYTSDHLNDQTFFNTLHENGILNDGRYGELSGFDWKKDIIIHEAGVPPLHTPIDTLLKLPADFKKNIYLVHTDKSKIPGNSGLKISPTGLAKTMIIDPLPTVHGESIEILNLITNLDIFEDVPLKKVVELLSIINYLKFKAGDCLIKQGNINNRFFIIVAGKAKITEDNQDKAFISSGSYFGETSLIQDVSAVNSIIAMTDIVAVSISKDNFISFISNLSIYEKLKKLAENRKFGSWEAINNNDYFSQLTISQKNNLEILFEEKSACENEVLSSVNSAMEYAFLWNTGEGIITNASGDTVKELKSGDFIGNPKTLLSGANQEFNIISKTNSTYFRIPWRDIVKFFQHNPKINLELRNSESL